MKEKKFGLIGEKLGHSCSPEIHRELADYEYKLYELSQEQLPNFLDESRCPLDGMNVTIPYKKAVIPFCRRLSPRRRADRLGEYNGSAPEGGFYGDNTDYAGFLHELSGLPVNVCGKKCLILGSGGVSLTVRTALTDLGAGEIVVISRTGENNYGNLEKHFDAGLIVNTTPVGMYPDTERSPLSLRKFRALEGVADLIFNPQKTVFVEEAEERGIPAVSGMSMLVAQAKAAAELFSGKKIPDSEIGRIEALFRNRF